MTHDDQRTPSGTAALYCLFGDIPWLAHSYASIYPCVDAIYFFISSLPWHGETRASEIVTDELAKL